MFNLNMMDLKVSGKKITKIVFSPCIAESSQGVEIAGGKSYEMYCGAFSKS